jgi:uncharacterized protein (TIGR02996 family)
MTSDGEALFRAICEQPWEDTPRLMYADWLEESGIYNGRRDPEEAKLRAAFIRYEITLKGGRFKDFEKAQNRWHKELPKLSGVSWPWSWSRGFPSVVGFAGVKSFENHADAVFAAAPVSIVAVHRVTAKSLPRVLGSEYLRRVEWFRPYGRIGDEGVRLIANCENLCNLEDLILCDVGMTDAGLEALACATVFKRLNMLHFGDNRVTDRGALALANTKTLTTLEEIGWPKNPITWKSLRPLRKRFRDPYTGGPDE